MRKLLIAAAILGLSGAAYASNPGFYVGGQFGYADTGIASHLKSLTKGTGLSVSSDDLGGRVFAGYQFNPNVAAELGYTRFSDVDLKGFPGTIHFSEQATDLVGKLIYPIPASPISLYGKAGMAYVDIDGHSSYNGVTFSKDHDAFLPEVGAGASYAINQNWSTNVDYTFIDRMNDHTIRNINFVSLGLAYHFA